MKIWQIDKNIIDRATMGLIFDEDHEEACSIAKQLLKDSKNTEDFVDNILNCEELKFTEGYAEVSWHTNNHEERIDNQLKDSVFNVDSMSSLEIGNDDFRILASYGGSGNFKKVAITTRDEFNTAMLNHFTVVKGKFNIYDINKEIVKTVEGEFDIYHDTHYVVFVESNYMSDVRYKEQRRREITNEWLRGNGYGQ